MRIPVPLRLIPILAFAAAATLSPAQAADYPKRPITIVVPYKTGGGTDAYARAFSKAAKGVLPVPVVIKNQGGSSGINGALSVLGARPDGHTVMLTSAGSFLLVTLRRKTPLDALNSFEFIAQIGRLKSALMVPVGSPLKTAEDVIAAAKSDSSLRWTHSGRGQFNHVTGMGFLRENGVQVQDVPQKGGGPARAALIGKQVDFAFLGVQQARGFEEQIVPLAVNSHTRDAVMDHVPTFKELGLPFVDVTSPMVLFAPKKTPPEAIALLEAAAEQITAKPEFAELLDKRGAGPVFASGADAKATLTRMDAEVRPLLATLK